MRNSRAPLHVWNRRHARVESGPEGGRRTRRGGRPDRRPHPPPRARWSGIAGGLHLRAGPAAHARARPRHLDHARPM